MQKTKINNPIFIVGVGRSGTSLLQSILNSHSDITFLPETQFLRTYLFSNKEINISKSNYRDIIDTLTADQRFNRLNIKANQIIFQDKNMYDAYLNLLDLHLRNKQKQLIGDKDPKNIEYIHYLHKFFPKAKLIHIIRDPRDVVLSRIKAKWSKSVPYYIHAVIYVLQLKIGRSMGKKIFNKNYHELYYEDLLINPEKTIRKIVKFIGVDYEEELLDYRKSSQELVSDDELDWKKETFKPIINDNFNKWKNQLSKSQILIIESICHFSMKKLPYKRNSNIFLRVLLIFLFHPFIYIIDLIYRLRIK